MGLLRRFRNRFLWATPNNVEKTAAQLDAINGQLRMIDERLGRMEGRMEGRLDKLHQRIEQADAGINGNLDHKCDAVLFPALFELKDAEQAHAAQQTIFDWELFRRPGEPMAEAKERFFKEMEPASGIDRLVQLGNARLLREFDELCTANHIDYWIAFGTLLGAVRHGGFIPWDDDVDVGMLRGDIERLAKVVEADERYRVRLVYDAFAQSRQIRFMFADEALPCFIDLFIFDRAPAADMSIFREQWDIRRQMMQQMDEDAELDPWREAGYLPEDSELSGKIEEHFRRGRAKAREAGIGESGDALIWGIDNLDDANGYSWISEASAVFPTRRIEFEGVSCNAPNDHMKFLDEVYGDIYSLPKDILGHSHFFDNELEASGLADSLSALIEVQE